MAESAESVVIAIEAQMGGFTPAVQQGATAFDASMKSIRTSATQMEQQVGRSVGNTRIAQMELMHVVRGSADSFASGTPPMMIFTQHLGMLAESAALAGGSLGKFGEIMGGVWGIAATAAVSILLSLIAGHRSAADEAHKHETAEQTLMRALNGEADAVGKVTDALRAMREESARALQTDVERIEKAHMLAQMQLAVALATRQRLAADLEVARQAVAATGANANDPTQAGEGGFNPGAAQGALSGGRMSDITARINENNRQIAEAQAVLSDTTAQFARNVQSHVAATNEEFNRRRGALENEIAAQTRAAHSDAERNQITLRAQAAEHALNVERERSVRAAQLLDDAEQGRAHRGPGEDVVDRADLLATARQHLGQTQGASTASLRSFFQQAGININPQQMAWCAAFVASVLAANNLPVARGPDGSPALNARGYLNYGSATTRPEPGDIVVLRDQSGRNRPDHGHTGFFEGFDASGRVRVLGGNQGRAHGVSESTFARADVLAYRRAPTAAEAQTQEQRAATHAAELADHRARDEERFQNELAGLNTELLNARRQQVQTEEQAAAADIAAINGQRDQQIERIRAEAADRTRRDSSQAIAANIEAGLLIAKVEELASIRRTARMAERDQRLGEQRLDLAISELNSAESIERARGALARTVGERRDSELRLLDYNHQEELLAIQKLRLQRNLTSEQRAGLDQREATANAVYGLAQQNIRRQNQTPLEQFFDRIPKTAAEMNEALQGVAVDGLQQLNTGLGEAASRFLHLGGVAGHVLDTILNDLIQIVLQQAELAAMGDGKGGGGGGFSGFFRSLGSMFGAAIQGGGSGGAGLSHEMGHFASGGIFSVGGYGGIDRNLLSINGQGRAMVSGDETIAVIPQGKALAFNGAAAAGGRANVTVQQTFVLDARHGITTTELLEHVNTVADRARDAGAALGVQSAEQRAFRRARQALA